MKFILGLCFIFFSTMVLSSELPQNQRMSWVTTQVNGQKATVPVNWVVQGQDDLPIIVAIHGTPGSWTTWKTLMKQPEISEQFQLIAVDRPGWGQSRSELFEVLPGFDDQSAILGQWLLELTEHTQQPVILLGHSWGGPVVTQLIIDFPELADAAVVVAAPFSSTLSKPRWYHRLANTKVIGWMIGPGLRRSNKEMLPLHSELASMETDLKNISLPVTIIQGAKDGLVDKDNAEFLQSRLTESPVEMMFYQDKGHLIPFRSPEIIVSALMEIRERLGAGSTRVSVN